MAIFKLKAGPLPTTFRGTLQQFFNAMLDRMEVETDGQLFTESDTAPAGDQGPWLKNGTKWYVWNAATSQYVPLDVSDSITAQIAIADTANPPDPTEFQFWLQTQGSKLIGLYYFVGTTSGWQPVFTNPLGNNVITTAMLQSGCVTNKQLAAQSVSKDQLTPNLPASILEAGLAWQVVGSTDGSNTAWFNTVTASSPQTYSGSAQTITYGHNLGGTSNPVVPNFYKVVFRCLTPEHGYAAGDEIDASTAVTLASGKQATIYANKTNISLILQGPVSFLDASNPSSAFHPTPANWVVVFYFGRG